MKDLNKWIVVAVALVILTGTMSRCCIITEESKVRFKEYAIRNGYEQELRCVNNAQPELIWVKKTKFNNTIDQEELVSEE